MKLAWEFKHTRTRWLWLWGREILVKLVALMKLADQLSCLWLFVSQYLFSLLQSLLVAIYFFFFSFLKFVEFLFFLFYDKVCFSLVICFLIFASYLILYTKKYLFGLCWKGETVTLLADEKACGTNCMVVIFVQLCWMVYSELSVIALFL